MPTHERPQEPKGLQSVWYRGWEISFDAEAAYWLSTGWRAYKGGCDLGAPQRSASTFAGVCDEIDEAEEE